MIDIEKAAEAWIDEIKRWGTRVNKGEKKPHEVFRFDDSGLGGSFSEIHGFKTFNDATEFFQRESLHRAIRAVFSSAGIKP